MRSRLYIIYISECDSVGLIAGEFTAGYSFCGRNILRGFGACDSVLYGVVEM